MKKIYNAPLTEVVKLKVREHMLESSPISVGGSLPEGQSGIGIQSNDDDYEDFDPSLW